MNLDLLLQHVLPRDLARAMLDNKAPLAMPVAELRTVHPGQELEPDAPITISLAALRACRPDGIARPDPIETARMVETVARRTYERTTGKAWADATTRVRKSVRDGVRIGLQEVGVVR